MVVVVMVYVGGGLVPASVGVVVPLPFEKESSPVSYTGRIDGSISLAGRRAYKEEQKRQKERRERFVDRRGDLRGRTFVYDNVHKCSGAVESASWCFLQRSASPRRIPLY
jgi:hypothetical protein